MGKRSRKKGKNKRRGPAPSKCRDCGLTRTIHRYEYFRAGRPRCLACGGTMEYLGGWQKTRSPIR